MFSFENNIVDFFKELKYFLKNFFQVEIFFLWSAEYFEILQMSQKVWNLQPKLAELEYVLQRQSLLRHNFFYENLFISSK